MKYEKPQGRFFYPRYLKNSVYYITEANDCTVVLINSKLPVEFIVSREHFIGLTNEQLMNVEDTWIWTDGDWYSPKAFPEVFDLEYIAAENEKLLAKLENH